MKDDSIAADLILLSRNDATLISFYSLCGGSTSLVPIPFLDDWLYRIVRRQLTEAVSKRCGVSMQRKNIYYLATLPTGVVGEGCLKRAFNSLIVWPFRLIVYIVTKIFKKILFILAVKEATDRASELFHYGYLLRYGLNKYKPEKEFDRWVFCFRLSLWQGTQDLNTSPVQSIFKAVFRLNRQALSKAAKLFRSSAGLFLGSRKNPIKQEQARRFLDQQENVLGEASEEAAKKILGDSGYLRSLRTKFDDAAHQNRLDWFQATESYDGSSASRSGSG
jgi:hypothetical protein